MTSEIYVHTSTCRFSSNSMYVVNKLISEFFDYFTYLNNSPLKIVGYSTKTVSLPNIPTTVVE